MLELFQIRYHFGRLEYRQRLTEYVPHPSRDVYGVLEEWGPWQDVPAVKGDESDQRWEE